MKDYAPPWNFSVDMGGVNFVPCIGGTDFILVLASLIGITIMEGKYSVLGELIIIQYLMPDSFYQT